MIGRQVAALCKAFGCSVLAYNRSPVFDPVIDRQVSLEELLALSDIISLHCPLTEETKGMIGAPQIAQMKQGAVLINTARGPLVDSMALAHALKTGQISGAACDVLRWSRLSPLTIHCSIVLIRSLPPILALLP